MKLCECQKECEYKLVEKGKDGKTVCNWNKDYCKYCSAKDSKQTQEGDMR